MPSFDLYWSTLAFFGIVSFILYVSIILTIIRYRKCAELQSSFFILWISLGSADCYQFVHSYVLMRFPFLNIFHKFFEAHESGFLPNYALVTMFYILYVQLIGNLLFALNRYSALTRMTRHDQIWSAGNKLTILIALQWTIPVLFIIHQLVLQTNDVHYVPLPPDNKSLQVQVAPQMFAINSTLGTIVMLFVMVVCSVLYILSIVKYSRHNKTLSSDQRRTSRGELRLLFSAVILFICLTAFTVYQAFVVYFSYMDNEAALAVVLSQWYLINDVYIMMNPWSLLITCAAVRKYLRMMLRLTKLQGAVMPRTIPSLALQSVSASRGRDLSERQRREEQIGIAVPSDT